MTAEELAFVEAVRAGGDDPMPTTLYADFLQERHDLTRREALLRAVLQAPGAVGPRLAYADCLEAEGEAERAGFVREPFGWPEGSGLQSHAYHWRLAAVLGTLAGLVPKSYYPYVADGTDLRSGTPLSDSVAGTYWAVATTDICLVVRNGFVTEVGCGQLWFLRAAGELFRRHPVRDVYLIGTHPDDDLSRPGGGYWRSWRSGPAVVRNHRKGSRVARPLYDRLARFVATGGRLPDQRRCYATARDACADLSRACVAHGRDLAGLAPLAPVTRP